MSNLPLTRRALLRFSACAGTVAASLPTWARAAGWLPYDPGEVRVLRPRSSDSFARAVAEFLPAPPAGGALEVPGYKRIGPAQVEAMTGPSARSALGAKPPTAYTLTAERTGVPAWLLFGVAMQESRLALGRETIPYPWTLCVRGAGERHASYEHTLARLKRLVGAGITNVDCGAMQVNWHWHQDKLRSFELALDPYPNLAVGARILRGHCADTGNWFSAVGLYHTGSVALHEQRSRARRYASSVFARLHRLGVDVPRTWSVPIGDRNA